ncbi:MAG: HD-GYP domain-containing protein [Chloroflexota bacterium]|nr:HD-GYP domain-containing protein [Chloroflexota bacterium]
MDRDRSTALNTGPGRQSAEPAARASELADAQTLRMAQDFATMYTREQSLAKDYEAKLSELALLERQANRYAEDLATLLQREREKGRELERALAAEHSANLELRRTGLQGVSHILMAVSLKDMTTRQHLMRVRKYVQAIAAELGLPPAMVEEYGYSSVLHDVGKIQTPDDILGAPHELSEDQYDVMKQHCIDGEAMLGDANFFATGRAVAREHHERWDGTGYPDRKKGDEISHAARIVAVADVYDALTSKRPYKEAWSPERGLAAIETGSGKQFDPSVVAAFVRLCREGAIDRIRTEVGDQP